MKQENIENNKNNVHGIILTEKKKANPEKYG